MVSLYLENLLSSSGGGRTGCWNSHSKIFVCYHSSPIKNKSYLIVYKICLFWTQGKIGPHSVIRWTKCEYSLLCLYSFSALEEFVRLVLPCKSQSNQLFGYQKLELKMEWTLFAEVFNNPDLCAGLTDIETFWKTFLICHALFMSITSALTLTVIIYNLVDSIYHGIPLYYWFIVISGVIFAALYSSSIGIATKCIVTARFCKNRT